MSDSKPSVRPPQQTNKIGLDEYESCRGRGGAGGCDVVCSQVDAPDQQVLRAEVMPVDGGDVADELTADIEQEVERVASLPSY